MPAARATEGLIARTGRRIILMCVRCLGTGFVARRGRPVIYCRCPRCGGSGGKTEVRT